MITFDCQPKSASTTPDNVVLLMTDMQRDFLETGGFGEALSNDVDLLSSAIPNCEKLLSAAREN